MATVTSRAVPTPNGRVVEATFFHPETAPRAALLIVAAMGVNQQFYAPLATWLAGRQFLVATFDYVGIGRSRVPRLADLDVDILDWVRFDCDVMVGELQRLMPGKEIYWIGHSLGGQILGLLPDSARLTKAVTVACGSGYWRENVPQLRRRVWWLWYVVVPIATRVLGYFPGKRLRKVGDLPRGVMEQWRRWCLNPEYAIGVEGPQVREAFAAVRTPITSLSFTDDEMMSARNIESLHNYYSSAPKKMARIAPSEAGVERIGHFGFFRDQDPELLWKRYLLPELAV
jgi:predicted alpha/beta hydrolase